jgi:hypothetical protein
VSADRTQPATVSVGVQRDVAPEQLRRDIEQQLDAGLVRNRD